MDLTLTVLRIVAPVFLMAGFGMVWVRVLKWDYPIQFVTRLAMAFALPCLMFTGLMQSPISPSALTTLSLATLVVYGALTLLFAVLVWLLGLDRRTYLAPLIFGNTGNLGLPLAMFAFGQEGLALALVVFAVMVVMNFTYGVALIAERVTPTVAFKEPITWGTIFGAVFLWQGWQTPNWMTNGLELAGQMAIPLMLLTLGVAVARLNPAQLGRAVWLSLLKAGVCAAVGVAVGLWFSLPPMALAVLVVQVVTPVAVTSYLLAEKYRADAGAVAGLVVVSTLLSVAVLPVALAFFV